MQKSVAIIIGGHETTRVRPADALLCRQLERRFRIASNPRRLIIMVQYVSHFSLRLAASFKVRIENFISCDSD